MKIYLDSLLVADSDRSAGEVGQAVDSARLKLDEILALCDEKLRLLTVNEAPKFYVERTNQGILRLREVRMDLELIVEKARAGIVRFPALLTALEKINALATLPPGHPIGLEEGVEPASSKTGSIRRR
jgi:hypothetical protein